MGETAIADWRICADLRAAGSEGFFVRVHPASLHTRSPMENIVKKSETPKAPRQRHGRSVRLRACQKRGGASLFPLLHKEQLEETPGLGDSFVRQNNGLVLIDGISDEPFLVQVVHDLPVESLPPVERQVKQAQDSLVDFLFVYLHSFLAVCLGMVLARICKTSRFIPPIVGVRSGSGAAEGHPLLDESIPVFLG